MDVLLKKVKYVSTAQSKFLSQNTLCRLLVAKKHFYKKAKVRRGTRYLIKLSGILLGSYHKTSNDALLPRGFQGNMNY